MAVVIDSGELPSARGKSGWELMQVLKRWQQIADGSFESDCRSLLQMIDETDELRLWESYADGFYETRDNFLQSVVLIDFDFAERSLSEIVTRLRHGERVGLQPLAKHGGARKQADNISLTEYGTAAAYTIRRLKRDRPDLAERVIEGELSANAAAIEAGFRRRTIAVPLDVSRAVAILVRHFGADAIRAALNQEDDE